MIFQEMRPKTSNGLSYGLQGWIGPKGSVSTKHGIFVEAISWLARGLHPRFLSQTRAAPKMVLLLLFFPVN